MNTATNIIVTAISFLLVSFHGYAANTKLARSKLDYHKGDIRKAHLRLWRLLKSDTLSQQRQLSNKERAEVRRLLGSSTYLLTGNVAKTRTAFEKSLEFARKKPLSAFEKRDQHIEAIYSTSTSRKKRRRIRTTVPKPVAVTLALKNIRDNSIIKSAIISVKDTYGPFNWQGEKVKLAPGKHQFRIEAPGYRPTQILWRVTRNRSNRLVQVNLIPLSIFTSH